MSFDSRIASALHRVSQDDLLWIRSESISFSTKKSQSSASDESWVISQNKGHHGRIPNCTHKTQLCVCPPVLLRTEKEWASNQDRKSGHKRVLVHEPVRSQYVWICILEIKIKAANSWWKPTSTILLALKISEMSTTYAFRYSNAIHCIQFGKDSKKSLLRQNLRVRTVSRANECKHAIRLTRPAARQSFNAGQRVRARPWAC